VNSGNIVQTDAGKIEGYEQRGLRVFKGVPFAEAPVGRLRWLPPTPAKPWGGVKPARNSAAIAPQVIAPSIFVAADVPPEQEPQSEDCLYLNVWTPGLDNARRPVMFWVHGGGFTGGSGSSAAYKGSRLAARGNVVVVTTNYRLGALGFLSLNEVTGGRILSTGNEGLLDQALALEWVRRNITAFGGDPDNVTIFGESAGGMSVGCQLTLPRAKGLFQRAILQSGATSSAYKPARATAVAEQFLDILKIKPTDADALYSIPAAGILAAQQELMPRMMKQGYAMGLALRPVVDGKVQPLLPIDAVRKGVAKSTPIIVGTNLDEWTIVNLRNQEVQGLDEPRLLERVHRIVPSVDARALIELYRGALARRGARNRPSDIFNAIETAQKFRVPAIRLAEAQQKHGEAYSYLFTWESPGFGKGLGTYHALELGFVFGAYDPALGKTGEALSTNFQEAWLAFARNGESGCEAVGKWQPYGKDRATMLISETCRMENDPYADERRAWDKVRDEEMGS